MRYVYSVVRFVPDPARGEFINVAAIVGSDENSEWKVRRIKNPVRAKYMDERNTLEVVWHFFDRIDQDGALCEAKLAQLYRDHRNIVQLSPPTPMVAGSAEKALEGIFEDLILDPPP